MTDVLEEIHRLRRENKDISNDDILLIQMISMKKQLEAMAVQQQEQLTSMEKRIKDLEDVARVHNEYPSITFLLRYRPKETEAWILIIFVLLSMWWVSGFRQPILEWLGLPTF